MPEHSVVSNRLSKLIVKNFRCIGSDPVEIDLDKIVVLVGPNNSGKSSILKAYQLVMSDGSNEAKLSIEDFPYEKIDEDNLPEIELHTLVYDNPPGERWREEVEGGAFRIREQWKWTGPKKMPERRGFDVAKNEWVSEVPWGAANYANSHRPQPHRVSAFDPPDMQTAAIVELLDSIIIDKLKEKKKEGEKSSYALILDKVDELQRQILQESREQVTALQDRLSELVSQIFPSHIVEFDPKSTDDLEQSLSLFSAKSQLRMGHEKGFMSSIDKQGSGAKRTLLWTTLKLLADEGKKAATSTRSNAKKINPIDPKRPHLLLLDEPEICLHPSAIREASDLLYSLPTQGNWQVMITTHSPSFINFSKDNTTIVRVEHSESGIIQGTTIYRTERVNLSDDDKVRLKLLNACDPYVAEFFFGGKTVLVEGDTEYTAFNYIKERHPEEFKGVHVVRARGKATIVSLMKILNQFGQSYSILHDSDKKTYTTKKGEIRRNSAWTANIDIAAEAKKIPEGKAVKLIASVPDFEKAYFNEEASREKPYNALVRLRTDDMFRERVYRVFKNLTGSIMELPPNAIQWSEEGDLEKAHDAYADREMATLAA